MTLGLAGLAPFARGGNRLCFVHPEHQDRCIKVRRPDFSLEDLRRSKGFPKNLRPLSSFDDNQEEFEVMTAIHKRIGDDAYAVISRCYGFEATDMGLGLSSELIRDADGRIARTLKQHIWEAGFHRHLRTAIEQFADQWIRLGVPSRDLLVHNIVVQCDDADVVKRLVVIDGLGSASAWPEKWRSKTMRQARSQRKIDNLYSRIDTLLSARSSNTFPGTHGLLIHDGMATHAANKDSP